MAAQVHAQAPGDLEYLPDVKRVFAEGLLELANGADASRPLMLKALKLLR